MTSYVYMYITPYANAKYNLQLQFDNTDLDTQPILAS